MFSSFPWFFRLYDSHFQDSPRRLKFYFFNEEYYWQVIPLFFELGFKNTRLHELNYKIARNDNLEEFGRRKIKTREDNEPE